MKLVLLALLIGATPVLASGTYIPKTTQLPKQDRAGEEREAGDRAPASETDSSTLRVKKKRSVEGQDGGDETYLKED